MRNFSQNSSEKLLCTVTTECNEPVIYENIKEFPLHK